MRRRLLIAVTVMLLANGALKTNAQSPDFEWAVSMGSTFSYDEGNAITTDLLGNVYVTGFFGGTVDFDPGTGTVNLTATGTQDIFVQKLDSLGNLIWAKAMLSTSFGVGRSITTDTSGNVYLTGWFRGTVDFDPNAGTTNLTSAGGDDIFIQKLDASGNLIWARSVGGATADRGQSIAVDFSGNVLITGRFQDSVDFDPEVGTYYINSVGLFDIYVLKLDATGKMIWATGTGGNLFDEGKSIATDVLGNVYVTGYFESTVDFDPGSGASNLTSAGGKDVFIQKLNAAGNFVWAKALMGSAVGIGSSIATDVSGDIYLAGYFQGTADFDPGTGTLNLTSAGSNDIFAEKLDSAGNLIWAVSMGGSSFDLAQSITSDAFGNAYVAGYFQDTADFDPGSGTANLISAGSFDIFTQKLDAAGNLIWATSMGGTSADIGNAIHSDVSGNIYITGRFQGNADFDPGVGTASHMSSGNYDIFSLKLSQCAFTIGAETISACNSYTWATSGITYNSTGAYVETLTNSVGCDSIVTLNLTIATSTVTSVTINACGSYTWPVDGNTYTGTGSYMDTLSNTIGCDSIVILNLTVNNGSTSSSMITACGNYTWPVNSNTYSVTGTYIDTLANANGCDSIVTLILTVNSETNGSEMVTTCGTYTWPADGNMYASSGTYTTNFINAAGCDSIVTLNLIVNKDTMGSEAVSACDSYTWIADGNTYTTTGTYTAMLSSAAGCDSLATLNLTINTVDTSVLVNDLVLTSNTSGANYQWIDCDGNNTPISGATNASYTVLTSGSYAVIITENNCIDTSQCYTITTVGIDENTLDTEISIFPNPTADKVAIDLGRNYTQVTIKVRSVTGQLISVSNYKTVSKLSLSIEGESGVYFLEIETDDGKMTTVKVLKE